MNSSPSDPCSSRIKAVLPSKDTFSSKVEKGLKNAKTGKNPQDKTIEKSDSSSLSGTP